MKVIKKIYLAGSLFSAETRCKNAKLAEALRERGYEVFNPQEANAKLEETCDTKMNFKRGVYVEDLRAIQRSDIMIADVSHKDDGTAAEIGYFLGIGEIVGKKNLLCIDSNFQEKNIFVDMLCQNNGKMLRYIHNDVDELVFLVLETLKEMNV